MATNFPGSLDNGTSLPYPNASNYTNSPSNAAIQDNQNDAIIATQTKVGTGASTPTSGKFLTGTGVGTSAWANTVPSGTVVGTSDIQTLTNKTLTSPTINSPTISNATISTDLITGYSAATSGTVYGIPVTTGVINTAGTINGASIVNSSIQTASIANNAITTALINDSAVTPAKLLTGTGNSWGWDTWNATWSSSGVQPTIGNGTLETKYKQVGKLVYVSIRFVVGSTTTMGTGTYYLSYPVTPASTYNTSSGGWCLNGYAEDAAVTAYGVLGTRTWTLTQFAIYIWAPQNASLNAWANNAPFTWATGDFFMATGFYEAA